MAAGAQVVQLFDSWVGKLSPYDYRRSVLPHIRRLFAGLADLGVPTIHFGTGTAGLLEAMAEAGGDAIGLDWTVELAEGRPPRRRATRSRATSTRICCSGRGTRRRRRRSGSSTRPAAGPGHVFNLGHGVLPPTDPDHLRRLVDLVHAHPLGGADGVDPATVAVG